MWIPNEWITVAVVVALLLLMAGMILPFFLTVATFRIALSPKGLSIEVLRGTPLIAKGTHFYAWKDVESYDMGEDGGNGMSYLVVRIEGPLNDVQLQNIRFEQPEDSLAALHEDFHAAVAAYQPEDGDSSHRPVEKSIWETVLVRILALCATAMLLSAWVGVLFGAVALTGFWDWLKAIVFSLLTLVYVMRVIALWRKKA